MSSLEVISKDELERYGSLIRRKKLRRQDLKQRLMQPRKKRKVVD
jgi:hypothetical protein